MLRMTAHLRVIHVAALAVCLFWTGCSPEKKPEKKVVKIGPENGAAAPAKRPAAVQPAPAAIQQPPPEPSRRRKKKAENLAGEIELGTGEQLFAVLPPSAPSGVPFAIDGAGGEDIVDRFAFVPNNPGVDSTTFAFSKNAGAEAGVSEEASEVGHLNDDSR